MIKKHDNYLEKHRAYEIDIVSKSDFSALESIRTLSSLASDKDKLEKNSKSIELENSVSVLHDLIARVSAINIDRTAIYLLWLRFSLLSLGFLGTILYYIKWQNKWAEHHSNSEFQLQQFYLDVNRSNWVIESCLEWSKEIDSAIPKELLASITNNLFVNIEDKSEQIIHPADELASALLGSASKLRLKVGDSELDFDKPSKISNKPSKVSSKPLASREKSDDKE